VVVLAVVAPRTASSGFSDGSIVAGLVAYEADLLWKVFPRLIGSVA